MKSFKLVVTGLLVQTLWVMTTSIVTAQVEGVSKATPLRVAGMRGSLIETRTLFLNAEGSITNLQPISLDLSRSDGRSIFPAGAITVQANSVKQPKPNQLLVPVNFNLQQVPSSGEFSGDLRLSYQGGDRAAESCCRR